MTRVSVATRTSIIVLILSPAFAFAQSIASGTIAGVVKDPTGAVLPGVTVEAASPALIEKVRAVVTDNQGEYKIVDLRPGTYNVTFTLPGFSTLKREGLELTTGFTATVNADLTVGSLEETVTVTGASPVVDIQNVRQQQVFSREVVDTVPISRSLTSYATLIPGAKIESATTQDVGGNQSLFPNAGIHGGRPGDQRLLVDGVRYGHVQAVAGILRGTSINSATVEEMTVEIGGISAEAETGGIQYSLVPKQGGNTLSGSFFVNGSTEKFANDNLSDELGARGLTTSPSVKRLHDLAGGIGGPIWRDRVWFYVAYRWQANQTYVPGLYYNATQDSWFYTPDLSRPAYTESRYNDGNIRFTWQLTQKQRISFAYGHQDGCACIMGLAVGSAAAVISPEATTRNRYLPNSYAQMSWRLPASDRLLFEAGAIVPHWRVTLSRQPGVSEDEIGVLELSRNLAYRAKAEPAVGAAYGLKIDHSYGQQFSVSYITGSHAFKTGVFAQEGRRYQNAEYNGSRRYQFLNGVPNSITQYAMPFTVRERLAADLGVYAQDQWTIRKLTLNLGLRYQYIRSYVPEQHLPAGPWVPARDFGRVDDVPKWQDLSPRVGAAYDLFGNGKTALKTYLGRYVATQSLELAIANNPVQTTVLSATRQWTDANGNFIPDCDLTSALANGECLALDNANFGKSRITTRYADDVLRGFGQRPYNWQASVAIQHELRPGVGLTLAYFRTWHGNFSVTDNLAVAPADFSPYCVTSPTDARLPGGGGHQICGLYDLSPAKFGQTNNLVTQVLNFGKQTEVFNGVDVTIGARFGQGGLLQGGLATGATVTDNCVVVDSPQQRRFCRVAPPWSAGTQIKLLGVYPLPWDFQGSATFQNLPGVPITASYVATNAQIAPSLGRNLAACGTRTPCTATAVVELIEPNTQFEDRLSELDIRLTRIFRMGRARLQGQFDVYNVFNASTILVANARYGPAWLRPTTIMGGRLFKFGAQFDF